MMTNTETSGDDATE